MRKELVDSIMEFGLFENKEIRYYLDQNFKYNNNNNDNNINSSSNNYNFFHIENTKKIMNDFIKKCFAQFNFNEIIFDTNNKFKKENYEANTANGISYFFQ